MKIGAERKKVIGLLVAWGVLAYVVYVQFFAASQPSPSARRPPPVAQANAARTAPSAAARRPTPARGGSFRPQFGPADSDEPLDPMTVDPTLRTDLWAKVRDVEFSGVQRNLFLFGERKVVVPPPSKEAVEAAQRRLANLAKPKAKSDSEKAAAKPQAPPITFKYYGFANEPGDSQKRAFLLDGEEVLIGGEGDVFKKRYKIIRIGVNSIVVEDLQYKNRQTLRLEQS